MSSVSHLWQFSYFWFYYYVGAQHKQIAVLIVIVRKIAAHMQRAVLKRSKQQESQKSAVTNNVNYKILSVKNYKEKWETRKNWWAIRDSNS